MATEKVRERKEKRRYTFVVVPDVKSEKTLTFSVTRWGFTAVVISGLVVIVALILAMIMYTPLGARIPIAHSEIAKRYERQIVEIQKQLHSLVQEVTVMRGYNFRLRKVLGERFSTDDSTRMMTGEFDTLSAVPVFDVQNKDTSSIAPLEVEAAVPFDRLVQTAVVPVDAHQRIVPGISDKLPLANPVSGYLTHEFDPERFHYGIDYAGKQGSPVFAVADGVIVYADWTYEDGFMMMISHALGYLTIYKHNQSLTRYAGDAVKRGEIIALLGNTGERSRGPHVHFEVWINGVVQNPANYLLNIN